MPLTKLDLKVFVLDESWEAMLQWMKSNLPALKMLKLSRFYIQNSEDETRCGKVFSGYIYCSTVHQAIMGFTAGFRGDELRDSESPISDTQRCFL